MPDKMSDYFNLKADQKNQISERKYRKEVMHHAAIETDLQVIFGSNNHLHQPLSYSSSPRRRVKIGMVSRSDKNYDCVEH